MLLVKNALRASLSKREPDGLADLALDELGLALALGGGNRNSSIVAMSRPVGGGGEGDGPRYRGECEQTKSSHDVSLIR